MGSPPPTRGTLSRFSARLVVTGITPAYAGNTLKVIITFKFSEDHPRLRGEHLFQFLTCWGYTGSPPPTRGTLDEDTKLFEVSRITPAYAGNTFTDEGNAELRRDHPRLRGEHSWKTVHYKVILGSPPPTRGTHMLIIGQLLMIGITPAYAGNTKFRMGKAVVKGDHPRLRGEHLNLEGFGGATPGSPPPTRGTLKYL